MLMNIHTRRNLQHEFNPSMLRTVELVLIHEIRSYMIVMDVMKTLMCFDEWNKFCVRRGRNTCGSCKCKSPSDCMDKSQWRWHNCSYVKRAMEKLVWYLSIIESVPTVGLRDDQLPPYHHSRNAYLFLNNRPLRKLFFDLLWHHHAARELLLHNVFWTYEACSTREVVYTVR